MSIKRITSLFGNYVLDPNKSGVRLIRVIDNALMEVRRLMFTEVMCLDVSGSIMAARYHNLVEVTALHPGRLRVPVDVESAETLVNGVYGLETHYRGACGVKGAGVISRLFRLGVDRHGSFGRASPT